MITVKNYPQRFVLKTLSQHVGQTGFFSGAQILEWAREDDISSVNWLSRQVLGNILKGLGFNYFRVHKGVREYLINVEDSMLTEWRKGGTSFYTEQEREDLKNLRRQAFQK